MEHGYFQQTFQRPVSPGQVLNVPLRFQPTDLVVPRGGQLRLTLAGSLIVNDGVGALAEFFGGAGGADTIIGGPSQPSLAFSQIQILHDCAHTSALRFHLAERRPHLLNVREPDEAADEPLKSRPSAGIVASSGGLARANICGRPPRGPDRLLK